MIDSKSNCDWGIRVWAGQAESHVPCHIRIQRLNRILGAVPFRSAAPLVLPDRRLLPVEAA